MVHLRIGISKPGENWCRTWLRKQEQVKLSKSMGVLLPYETIFQFLQRF